MFKLLKIYATTHKKIKILALQKDMTMQDFIEMVMEEYNARNKQAVS